MKKGSRVLIDTNAIIEAHRLGCWKNLIAFFSMETVQECLRESATGRCDTYGYVPIDIQLLRQTITIHSINDKNRTRLLLSEPEAADLDAGEKDLLAFAITQSVDVILICSPDRACMRVAAKLGLLDRLVSLESLSSRVGRQKLKFEFNFTKQWHKKACDDILFG